MLAFYFPGVVDRSVIARLKLLSADGLKWLEALTVLGRRVPEAVVAELASLDEAAAREAAEENRLTRLALFHQTARCD